MAVEDNLTAHQEFSVVLGQRLREFRLSRQLTVNEIVNETGFGLSQYSNWELGLRSPKVSDIARLEEKIGIDGAYLLGLKTQGDGHLKPFEYATSNVSGVKNLAQEQDNIAYRRSFLETLGVDAEHFVSLIVSDNAMHKHCKENDEVLIDRKVTKVTGRDMFALVVNDLLWIRWIRPELTGGYTVHADDSKNYPDYELSKKQLDDIKIIGRVCRYATNR